MRQQTLEPVTLSQLSLLPNSPTPDIQVLGDAVEQTRQLFNHTGSDAELLLKVQALTGALQTLCPDLVPLGDR